MKKLYSLIKATMTSDMNLFKIKQKKTTGPKKLVLPIFLSLCFMFAIWSNANLIFEKLAPLNLQALVLALFVLVTSIMTIIEGIYKSGSLLFNCKDDQLLLSLPIKRSTVIFIRVFKFYVFELFFNSLFLIPVIVSYLSFTENLNWTFFLTSIIMIFLLPIIPIIISCLLGAIISSISSRFKYKNFVQILVTIILFLGIMYLSYNLDSIYKYIAKHATSVNDFITKLYYPAGIYAKLVTEFNIKDLLIFILVNIGLFILMIVALSKYYFKINSRLKSVSTLKKTKINDLVIKSRGVTRSLIKKELNTFFNIPVFIINAGFALVLYFVGCIYIVIKPNILATSLAEYKAGAILSNYSIIILILIIVASFMTSITNSLISLEGKNINILKSLPVTTKTILMSKIYTCLVITTPVLILGDIILFIKFKIGFIEILLLLLLSIILPLVSHFIGLIVNLKFPKLDAESSTEIVKQSISSFISVMIGMLLLLGNIMLIVKVFKSYNAILVLIIFTCVYLIIDVILYIYLSSQGIKDFNNLTI